MKITTFKRTDKNEHPNAISLQLTRGADSLELKFNSTGGGRYEVVICKINGVETVLDEHHSEPSFDNADEQLRKAIPVLELTLLESPLTFFGLSQRARDIGVSLSEFALLLENYIAISRGLLQTREQVIKRAQFTLKIMLNAVEQGIQLPQETSVTPGNWAATLASLPPQLGPLSTAFFAGIGAQEYNAGLGFVAAAPTCGASGTLPGTLYYFKKERGVTDDELVRALLVAGLIGLVAFSGGPVSGAQAGCGAEIGIAAMMSAGAAAFLMGGSAQEIDAAAALVGQNYQALECSPKGGYVEFPCIPRNGFAAVQAILSAWMAVCGLSGPYMLDDVVTRIFVLGGGLPTTLRESESGENMETFLKENCCGGGCSGCPYGD